MIKVRNLQFKTMFMFIAWILLFVGCVPERKLAGEYLSQRRNITLVIKAPELMKMVNMTADTLQDSTNLSQREKDSIKFYHSKILQNITDSVIIGKYVRSLKSGFERQGYKTMIASGNDPVFDVNGDAVLINIGQIELDEQKYPVRDETNYNKKLYAADYDLTKIEMSFWIEVSKIEKGVAVKPPRLLYDTDEELDKFQGHFELDAQENKVLYRSNIEEITPEYVDSLATSIGSDHAFRLNDFMMNEFISNSLPEKKYRALFGINQQYGNLVRIYDPPFKEIPE